MKKESKVANSSKDRKDSLVKLLTLAFSHYKTSAPYSTEDPSCKKLSLIVKYCFCSNHSLFP